MELNPTSILFTLLYNCLTIAIFITNMNLTNTNLTNMNLVVTVQ